MAQITSMAAKRSDRLETMKRIAFWLLIILFFKTVAAILVEYRNYFPANFDSNFLYGREAFFHGSYRFAFYAHIISGPICLLIAAFLMFSGKRKSLGHWHRRLGKTLAITVLVVMLPSGFVMATRALSGPIAGVSFFLLTFATAGCVIASSWYASQGRFANHQVWATRSFILLCSPLLLRLMTGTTIFFEFENAWTYRFAAWGSWVIPLTVFELFKKRKRIRRRLGANFFKGAVR